LGGVQRSRLVHSFDAVTIKVDDKRRVVGWTEMGTKSWRAVVSGAVLQCRLMKRVHGIS
jgi:hypothetical protein